MKSLLSFSIFIIIAISCSSQSTIYKPFRVDIKLGGYESENNNFSLALLISIEPRYALRDQVFIGFELEPFLAYNGFDQNVSARSGGSYMATGDYYFTKEVSSFCMCVGMGILRQGAIKVGSNGDVKGYAETKFVTAPRAVFEYGQLEWKLDIK